MGHSRSADPTVFNPPILATEVKYDVPVNQAFDFAGIFLSNLYSLCKSNSPPEPTPNYPYHLYSTSSFVSVEHPMNTSELSVPRKDKSGI